MKPLTLRVEPAKNSINLFLEEGQTNVTVGIVYNLKSSSSIGYVDVSTHQDRSDLSAFFNEDPEDNVYIL